MTTDQTRRSKIAARFAAQTRFCEATSPLYCRLFAELGRKLAEDEAFAIWLLAAARERAAFDVPLLLAAGLHWQILRQNPKAGALAGFYPSAGGGRDAAEPGFAAILAQTVDALRPELADFLAIRTVQTNESRRGLCWLLPAIATGWPAVHLAELGASAGLNLAADERHYVVSAQPEAGQGTQAALELGRGAEPALAVQGGGLFAPLLSRTSRNSRNLPEILSRDGCDLAPLPLGGPETAATAATSDAAEAQTLLAAFVWPDQPGRLQVLQEGIAAVRRINQSQAPIRLSARRLPEDLPAFLQTLRLQAPCILFYTYLTTYLPDKGQTLPRLVDAWARQQPAPVLWLQWEPLRGGDAPEAPALGWLGWTADLWTKGIHQRWQLAWVHPHGSRVAWLPGLAAWQEFWQRET